MLQASFTRDPSTGENNFYGEFLVNAQGEDVVAGIRAFTFDCKEKTNSGLNEICLKRQCLACLRNSMMFVNAVVLFRYADLEFTVQQGKLYMLQLVVENVQLRLLYVLP